MTAFLIAFPSSAMDHVPAAEMAQVGDDAHAVIARARDAGVYVFGGGLDEGVPPVLVSGDGTVTEGSYPETARLTGGTTVVSADSREVALEWATRIAVACRCPQEVREFMFDPLA